MTTALGSAVWMPARWKEVRALAPVWAAACLLSLAFRQAGVFVFVIGAAAVGALTIGQELGNGTLGLFLSEPRSRRDQLLTKLSVLIPMEALLALAVSPGALRGDFGLEVILLPALAGFCVAPWLTMACRDALAGTVFTIVLPGAWGIAGVVLAPVINRDPTDVGPLAAIVGTSALCVVGAVAGWRTFMRLEVVENVDAGRSRARAWSEPLAGSAQAGRHRLLGLVAKETRFQLMPLAVALLFGLGTGVLALAEHRADVLSRELYEIAPFYVGITALLVGALPSAEERALGTLQWQLTLPISTAAQWTAKVVVALATSAVLTVALPAAVLWIVPATRNLVVLDSVTAACVLSAPLVLIGLYVSSISRSGLWAFLASVAAVPLLWSTAILLGMPQRGFMRGMSMSSWAVWRTALRAVAPHGLPGGVLAACGACVRPMEAVVFATPLAAAMWFALGNHRSGDRGPGRVMRQVSWILVSTVLALEMSTGVFSAARWDERTARFESLQAGVDALGSRMAGQAGICTGSERFLIACAEGTRPFTLGGVWRLPLAVAALHSVDQGTLRLDESIEGPDGATTIDGLLRMALTDDHAADLLAAKIGGPPAINATMRRLQVGNIIVGRDDQAVTPQGLAVFLRAIKSGPLLSAGATSHLLDLIRQSDQGAAAMTADLPAGWRFDRLVSSTNDAGYLISPDGTSFVIIVLSDAQVSVGDRRALTTDVLHTVAAAYAQR